MTTGNTAQANGAIAVGGVGACGIIAAAAACNLEFHATKRFLSHTVYLGDQKAPIGVIVEIQDLGVVCVHNHSLAAGVLADGVTFDGFHLSDHQSAGNTGNLDLSVLIGAVQTIA